MEPPYDIDRESPKYEKYKIDGKEYQVNSDEGQSTRMEKWGAWMLLVAMWIGTFMWLFSSIWKQWI